jgi:hypothetical protein
VDTSFGTSGKVTTTFGTNTTNEAFDTAIQSDDKIIAVGYTGNDIAIARYHATTLSANDFESNSITMYPNPVKNEVTIDLSNKLDFLGKEFQIFDINTRIIFEGKINEILNTIDVSSLQKGMYFIKIDKTLKKFIKE